MKVLIILGAVATVHTVTAFSWWWNAFHSLGWRSVNNIQPKSACANYECPKYKVVEKHKGYELRSYKPAVWVVARVTLTSDGEKQREFINEATEKLARYMNGDNMEERTLNWTVPAVLHTTLTLPSVIGDVYVARMIPKRHSKNPPIPTDNSLYFKKTQRTKAYVRSYIGFGNEMFVQGEQYRHEMNILSQSLSERPHKIAQILYTEYDLPSDFGARLREVIMLR